MLVLAMIFFSSLSVSTVTTVIVNTVRITKKMMLFIFFLSVWSICLFHKFKTSFKKIEFNIIQINNLLIKK